MTCTDASWANEKVEEIENFSQEGGIIGLAPSEVINAETVPIHMISWYSKIIQRQCRATLQAEGYSMTTGVERGARIRAAVVDARGLLSRKQ